MKKLLFILLCALMLLSLAACSGGGDAGEGQSGGEAAAPVSGAPNEDAAAPQGGDIDLDLTELSSTMVYAEVFNIVNDPEAYAGQTVRMRGEFAVAEGENRNYYACIIADATACCASGIEFVLSGGYTYPDDYPAPGEEITVTGVFGTYEEEGMLFCELRDAYMS
ncbi:MAG: hypothetical protein IIY69_03165 [Clostridia bacterium]|nr:hypothetical protein [Clostridia bacterium]